MKRFDVEATPFPPPLPRRRLTRHGGADLTSYFSSEAIAQLFSNRFRFLKRVSHGYARDAERGLVPSTDLSHSL